MPNDENIEKMIQRLNNRIKNPRRYLKVGNAYIPWKNQVGIQTVVNNLVGGFQYLEGLINGTIGRGGVGDKAGDQGPGEVVQQEQGS